MAPEDFHRARKEKSQQTLVDNRLYLPQVAFNLERPEETIPIIIRRLFGISAEELPEDEKESFKMERIFGGLSNTIFRVFVPLAVQAKLLHGASSVLVRVFGAEGMIDRDIETATFAALAKQKIAPPYYGRFANGRIEGWMDGMRSMKTREMPEHSLAIARAMAALHVKFDVPEDLTSYHNPEQVPSLWSQLEDWWKQAMNQHGLEPNASIDNSEDGGWSLRNTLIRLQAEFTWLRELTPESASVSFCHNDILSANILIAETDEAVDSVQLIDFEYGGINYRSFDIANHFNEYAGGPPDLAEPNYEWLPSEKVQRDFAEAYLEAVAKLVGKRPEIDLYYEIQVFLMSNNLYWGLWSVNQAATEGCEFFDFNLYARSRIKQYWACKKAFLSR